MHNASQLLELFFFLLNIQDCFQNSSESYLQYSEEILKCSLALRTSDSETKSDNESEHSDALSSDIDIIDDDDDECFDYD